MLCGGVRRVFGSGGVGRRWVSLEAVKKLRTVTGAPMKSCKEALSAEGVDGDVEKAVVWLRDAGLAVAAKKSSREVSEGLVGALVSECGTKAVLARVNCETDFVARNAEFQALCAGVLEAGLGKVESSAPVLEVGAELSLTEAMQGAELKSGESVADAFVGGVTRLGENLVLDTVLGVTGQLLVPYVHGRVGEEMKGGLGSIAVVVGVGWDAEGAGNGAKEAAEQLGKTVAMQVAAMRPLCLSEDSMDPADKEREWAKVLAQAQEQGEGKPEAVVQKIAKGRWNKFLQDAVLLHQQAALVPDNPTILQLVQNASKEHNTAFHIQAFHSLRTGA